VKNIILGGGCFWCLDPVFKMAKGVSKVVVGFAGGPEKNPSYYEVANGKTGHAEVIKITYDSNVIDLKKILEIFFTLHDPTTLNRQGADKGTQYRSIILYDNNEDKLIANKIISDLNNAEAYPNSIVTELAALEEFYLADEEHQDYFNKNPHQAYCQIVIAPKIEKFNKVFNN
jgi:methionine-S-sulfoxide reductase